MRFMEYAAGALRRMIFFRCSLLWVYIPKYFSFLFPYVVIFLAKFVIQNYLN